MEMLSKKKAFRDELCCAREPQGPEVVADRGSERGRSAVDNRGSMVRPSGMGYNCKQRGHRLERPA